MDDLGFREEEERNKPCEIAQISFAYENGDIIEKLKYRGDYIAKEEYKKVKEINEELYQKVAKNDKFLDKCQTPCSVFVTFMDEEGVNRAKIYNKQPQKGLVGVE